jgi:hypothetical protein
LNTRSSRKSARRGFDDAAEQIDCHAVFPHRARLMRERRLGEPLDLLRRRELARVVVTNAREVEPCLDISILDRSVDGDLPVGQSRRMAEQILHRHLALRRNRDVAHARELVVTACYAHLLALEGREELRHGIGQLDRSVLHQHHRRDRDQRLSHGIDAEQGIKRHRLAFVLVLETAGVGIDELALAGDQHDRARKLAVRDVLL